jgi:hypothetical protein
MRQRPKTTHRPLARRSSDECRWRRDAKDTARAGTVEGSTPPRSHGRRDVPSCRGGVARALRDSRFRHRHGCGLVGSGKYSLPALARFVVRGVGSYGEDAMRELESLGTSPTGGDVRKERTLELAVVLALIVPSHTCRSSPCGRDSQTSSPRRSSVSWRWRSPWSLSSRSPRRTSFVATSCSGST